MRNWKRLFSLTFAFIVPLLLLGGLLMTLNSQAAPATSTEPSPPQPNLLLEAIRQGKYPAQLAGHSGDIRPDRYGPQRNDPAEGVPAHAYSLFDERGNGEYPCPPGGCQFAPGELLVKLKADVVLVAPKGRAPTADADSLNAAFQAQGVMEAVRIFPVARKPLLGVTKQIDGMERLVPDLTRWYKLALPKDVDVQEAVAAFRADPNVEHAELNYIFTFDTTPNDPYYYPNQWHLHNDGQYYLADADIDAPEAWDIVTGTETIVIAVIDTGIDRDHPDLDDHIWTNPGETPANGMDDDSNGYVDDTWGWNWVSNQSDPDDFEPNDPRDDNGHGTHVAGIAAAETNNGTGVAGVCWNCKVMSLKAFERNGTGTTSDIVQAINYAADKGADVINMSFGSYAHSQLLEDTLADAYGQALLVAAAGNGIRGKGTNIPFYPAAISYVMGVGASDVQCVQRDPVTLECLLIAEAKAQFSNYGVNSDVCAPGVSIYSTYPGSYASMAGTSMAAPVVSGMAGLMMGHFPTWSKESFRGQIINTTDGIYSDLKSFPACGSGRVNAYSALTVIPVPDLSLLTDSIEYGDATGDEDGIPDAGETVTVTMLVKDYWGEATNVIGTLSTSDPYVTLLDTDGIWGDISAYATMRNSGDPFAFSLDPAAPNNHQVNFTLDVTSNGGAYTAQASFSFLVQRGIEIPHALFPAVIDQDMTLHSDYLYIVKQNMLVQQGITLTIEPGTRLQFDPDKFIKIQGTLIASGTADLPIYFTSNQKDPQPGDFKGVIFDDLAVDATLAPMPTVTLPAAEGSAILGIGTVITLTNPPQFSAAGDVYFSAVISGTPNYEGIFRYVDGVGVEPEIVAGDAAPSGGQFIGFDEFYVSDYGDVHFIGQISGGSATNGMFKKTFDGLTTIVEAGDAVPAVSGGTFTGFKHLTVNDYGNDSWVAFAGTYDDGAGGTGIGLYVQRADLDRLLKVPFDDVTWATGTVQEIHAVWIGSPWQGGPDAMLSGSSGVALTYSGYNDTYQNYYSYVSWTEHWDMPTPLGGTFDTGTDDRRYYLNYTWYTAMGIKNGSVSRALFKCESPVGCTDTSQVVRKDGDPLPGGGILDLSGPFDLAWDGSHLVFGAVVSGTNTTRLVRILDGGSMENVFAEGFPLTDSTTISSIGSLPNGVFANPHGEYALLVDTTSGQRVMCTKPRNEYVGGSILDHVILEYGGGLALEGAYPYVANSIFRTSTGVAFTGQSCPAAIVAVNRIDGGQLIFTHSHVVDNTGRGMFVQGSQGRVVIAYSELSRNVESNWIPNCEYLSGGALLEGPITVVESDVSYNQVRYGGYSNAAGVRLIGYQGRLLSTRINRNQMSREAPMYPMPAGIKLEGGPHVIYGNTISSNRDWRGAPAQGENVEGGSALQVGGAAILMSFNTVVGNQAYPNSDSQQNRPLPGPAVMMYNYPGDSANQLSHNNILGNDVGGLFDEHGQPIPEYDLYLSNYLSTRKDVIATQNYWGTTDVNTIKYDIIYDYDNDFAPGTAYFEPFLTAPEPRAPGFLWQAATYPPDPIGAETMTVTLDFSRDMNTVISPTVTFGVDEPYTQNSIEEGQWISPTRWVGSYPVETWTGDGINTLRVTGAEDTGGMEIPEDTRFQFVIQVAGTSAMLLEGDAGLGYVHLTWPESDIKDLAGYVIYRSPMTNTNYSPIATVLTTTYTDTNVINSQLYYYKYTILNTDFEETAESNEIALVPDDFTDPTTPVVTDDGTYTHIFTQLHATWSASDPETGIVEYKYCIGTAVGVCDTVGWTSLGVATEVTKAGLNLQDGETYYFNVQARNGAGHWSEVGSSDGITVDKLPAPTISAVEPITGVRTLSHVIAISGSDFATPTVKLANTTLGGVVVNTSAWLSATIPSAIAAGVYTVTVTNYDTQWAMLTNAYTATNPAHPVAPVSVSPASGTVGTDEASYTVNIDVGTVNDLGGFQFDLLFDPAAVQVSDANLGWLLGSSGRSTAAVGPDIDNVTGIVTFGGYSYGSNPGANGSGTLATVTFTPMAQGNSALIMENVQLVDTVEGVIPVQLNDGQVSVIIYPAYDFDRDCEITVIDIMRVASHWNTHLGDPNYDPTYDLDSDDDIDVVDIMKVVVHWGETCE